MKKLLVILLICLMAFGAFAQINISGRAAAKGVFSSAEGGLYGMSKGFWVANDGSRLNIDGNWEGKAGVSADLRVNTDKVNAASFWAWARPADWFKINLGWYDLGDYLIKDGTETVAFGGNFRNSGKIDSINNGGFGVLGQFMFMDGNMNLGVALIGSGDGKVTTANARNSEAYIAGMFKIPNIGRAAVELQMRTTDENTADYFRASATFQYQAKIFDVGLGVKYSGKGYQPYKDVLGGDNYWQFLTHDAEFGVMLLAGIRPIEKLNIALGLQMYFINHMQLADTVSISYDFGFLKPVLYAYGMTSLESKAVLDGSDATAAQVIGLELNIPIAVGKSSMLAAGVAYDTAASAFQVPVFFRLFF